MPRIEATPIDGYCSTDEIACVSPMVCIAYAVYTATEVRVTKLPICQQRALRALTVVADFVDVRYASNCSSVGKQVLIKVSNTGV